MFEMAANPMYNTMPTTPPGWWGVPYMLGPIVAGMTGGVARPYVAPNMSTFDATLASQVNNPLYKSMMANMYGQLGTQLGTTMGDLRLVQSLGGMAGYSPAETQRALQGGAGAFARSAIGGFVMPFVDSGLNAMGLTGGSFVAATQAAFNGRMNLMGPGALMNPFDAGQQHQAMAAASAAATMLNNIVSQRDANGQMLLMADQRVTQGFSRERITQLAMQAAGRGMFTANADKGFNDLTSRGVGGLSDRLTQAVGSPDFDLSLLTVGNFDEKVGGAVGTEGVARKIRIIKDEVTRGIQGMSEAMGAMRDLTGAVDDELERLLDTVTSGSWNRSANNAQATRDALRTLHAGAQLYNIDPRQALNQVIANRALLQDAAGFDGSMLSLGFDGGGMFGLAAQTSLMLGIEDMITARGVRGDPVLSGRLRQQGVQAMAKNINSVAGRGAQVLAYARQIGAVSEDQAGVFAQMLSSGDSALMDSGLNRLLTTVFGSAEAGRRFMNDSMQMNSMRMAMNDGAGKFAMDLTMNGTDAEFHRREQMAAADQRLAFTVQALSESGMNTWQSAAGAGKIVDNIVASIRGDGKDSTRATDASAFRAQYDALVAKGMDPRAAASAVVAAFKKSPTTSQYAQEIDLAVKQQSAINNETALEAGGLESRQAAALVRELTARGGISGKDSAEVYRMIREGNGAGALSRVEDLMGGLDAATRDQMRRVRANAAQQHEDALETMRSNAEAEKLIGLAAGSGYGGEDVAKAYERVAAAGLRYASGDMDEDDYEHFWDSVSKSDFVNIFGDDAFEEMMKAAKGGRSEYFQTMGRRAGAVRRAAIANLKNSGYGLQMSGYWGGGLSVVSSEAARRSRDQTIGTIVANLNQDAFESAGERDTLAANIADFMMGNKDWKALLKVYDPNDVTGIRSGISKYGEAYGKYEEAQAAFNETQAGYQEGLKQLGESGLYTAYEFTNRLFREGNPINIGALERKLSGADRGTRERILAAAKARNSVIGAKDAADRALGDAVKDDRTAMAMKGLTSWDSARKQRNARLAGDEGVSKFLDAFDFSPEGIAEAEKSSGASKAFLDKMFSAVSDDEVAARLGVRLTKGMKRSYGEVAMSVVREKAMQGDQKALDAMRAARTAQRDADTRIHGTITIKNGWDSSPAVLEGNLGGLS